MPWFTEEDVILTQLHYHRSPSLLYNVTQYNQQICIRVELSIVFNTRLTKLIGRLSYSFLRKKHASFLIVQSQSRSSNVMGDSAVRIVTVRNGSNFAH